MSGQLGAFDAASEPIDEHEGRFPLKPAEGWTTFLALVVMLLAAAFAVDDANWAGYVAGSPLRQTSFLPFGVFLAVCAGLVLGKSRLSTVAAHFVGAALGAAYLLISVSGSISRAPGLEQRLRDLNESVSTFVNDAVVLGIRSGETSVFLLILGALVWAAGQFAAYSVFRRRRPLPAIVIASTILLVNMSITVREQYVHLVVFATAALWLLVRLNLLEQVAGWRARRIGDGGYVSELFMRSGAVFVALAIVGSLTLAANASSAPLARAWRDVDDQLLEIGYEINRWVGGVSGPARGPSNLFAPSQIIRDNWESSSELVFTATTSDQQGHYYRGATYDIFDGRGWQQGNRVPQAVAVGEPLLQGTGEQLSNAAGRRSVTVTITSADLSGDYLVAPEAPDRVDRPIELLLSQPGGAFVGAQLADGLDTGDIYTVVSLVPDTESEDAVTGNELAAAGVTGYPEFVRPYFSIVEDSIGRRVYSETDRIVSRLPRNQRDPYHIARAVQDYLLRDGGFEYETNVPGVCSGQPQVDCFLTIRHGHCEMFATAMVMMLRTQNIPARYVLGYLPGKLADGVYSVDRSAAHAWVEVYFPGYGWIRFDPTPGNRENGQTPTRLEEGAPVPTPPRQAPGQTPSFVPPFELDPEGDEPIGGQSQVGPESAPSGGPDLLAPFVLLALALGLLLLVAVARFRRLPQTEPDLAYRSVARLATRFGHGPRPTQTAYEFADGLGALVPAVRGELRVVATAKVEATYARRQPHGDALQALREAYARVRIGLLRLLLRKPSLPRRARGVDFD